MLSLKGPCQTLIGTRTAGLDALHLASMRIATGEWNRAIVGAAEEHSPLVNSAYRHWGLHSDTMADPFSGGAGGFVAGCGAVTLVLESAESMAARGVAPRGKILASTGPMCESPGSIRRARDLFNSLGASPHVISSANGTWLDRLESIASGHGSLVASLIGHIAETYSVMPLAAIAAALLTGQIPSLVGSPDSSPTQMNSQVGILCSDYTGLLSAATIHIERDRVFRQA
jgi:hypothetical protein